MTHEKLLLVDLNRGSYCETHTGHEIFNLEHNRLDGKYYGYIPPGGKIQIIDKLDAKGRPYVDGVTVVYVQALSEKDTNRKIIAFCTDARVYREPQSGERLNRGFEDKDGQWRYADWYIVSDNLINLTERPDKFTIKVREHNPQMFRKQRTVLDDPQCHSYPPLRQQIIDYISGVSLIDEDLGDAQDDIQRSEDASKEDSETYGSKQDEEMNGSSGKYIKKNPAIAKRVLKLSDYQCLCDNGHTTFQTRKGNRYMEGHHLIPCTVLNSRRISADYHSRLDREENIVCVCPTCHRAIHYGDEATRTAVLRDLFDKQRSKLFSVGININFEDMLAMYTAPQSI